MIIKLLDKHSTSFLTEPFIENIINPLKYNKKLKRLANKRISERGENNIRNNVGLINAIDHSNLLKIQGSNYIKIPDWPYGPKENSRFLYYIKGESASANMKKAESQVIKQFFANKINFHILAPQNSETGNQSCVAPLPVRLRGTTIPPLDFLFSLNQIKSEKVEQARLVYLGSQANSKGAANPIKRIQNKNYSEFKNQLRECKKIRLLYGHLSKRDLQKSLVKVEQSQGLSSENLLIYLETRLDVILERCGFFPSIKAARQSVIHGRIQINFKVIKIPSFQLKPGDIIKVVLSTDACTPDQIRSSVQKFLNFQRCSAPITLLTVKEWYSDVVVGITAWISNYLSKVIGTCKRIPCRNGVLPDIPPLTNGSGEIRGACTYRCEAPLVPATDKLSQGCKQSKMQRISQQLKRSKKYLGSSTQSVCSFTTFAQTHSYFQSILFLLSLLKNKSKQRGEAPRSTTIQKCFAPLGTNTQAKLNNLGKEHIKKVEAPIDFSNRFETTSVIPPSLNIWRFNLSPYVIFSILEIQSMFKNFALNSLNSKLLGTPSGAASRCNHFLSRSTFRFKDLPAPIHPSELSQAELSSGQGRLESKGASVFANKNIEKKYLDVYALKESGISSQSSILIKNREINLEKCFLNVFYYWLEVKNILLYPRSKFWRQTDYKSSQRFFAPIGSSTPSKPGIFDDTCIQSSFFKNKEKKTNIIFPSLQTNYLQKQSKPLHLEISYSSLCAIFLFPPQQIYSSALVDVDLIVRSAAIKK